MGDRLEFAFSCDAYFQFAHHTITDLDYTRTMGANQMMLMPVVPLINQGKPRHSVTEVESFHHVKTFE